MNSNVNYDKVLNSTENNDFTFEGNNLIEAFLDEREPLKDNKGIIYAWRNKDSRYMINYSELSYHRDWNKLMMVIEKLEEQGATVSIYTESSSIVIGGEWSVSLLEMVDTTFNTSECLGDKLTNTYCAVVSYIEWKLKQ